MLYMVYAPYAVINTEHVCLDQNDLFCHEVTLACEKNSKW